MLRGRRARDVLIAPPPSVRGRGYAARFRHPAQAVVGAFAIVIVLGALLLWVPFARAGPGGAPFLTALFTSTSAVCVTGLTVVDTGGYWSGFGEGVILVLIQVGGFGIMSLASLLALFVYRHLGVWARLIAQSETKTFSLGDVRRVLVGVAVFSLVFEAITAAVFTLRLVTGYEESFVRALYLGVFHAVSAFNNAGFSVYEDSLMRFVSDWWINVMVAVAVILGGLGFPVLIEVRRSLLRVRRWSLHTKLTMGMTAALLVLGTAFVLALEWTNPATLGELSTPNKLLAGFFHGVTPRTAGFNTLDVAAMDEATWLVNVIMMFIGGASAGTAGGVKVTTIALVGAMVWAEARGQVTVDLLERRIPGPAQRQALSVVVLGMVVAVVGTLLLMLLNGGDLSRSMFEAFSAFGTVGLSTGITADMGGSARVVLIALMFIGRLGPITLGAALALREHRRLYEYPEERPIVG